MHDRDSDSVRPHLLVFEGNGRVRWFEGNFAAYEEQVLAHGDGGRQRSSRKVGA